MGDLREARKAAKAEAAAASKAGPKARGLIELPEDDLEGEVEYLAFRPSVGDLAANVVLGATILWLPLSFAAIGRFTFVKYRLTDRRLTVRSEPPVGEQERTDVPLRTWRRCSQWATCCGATCWSSSRTATRWSCGR